MQKYLAIAITVLVMGAAAPVLADRDRGHYYRDHGRTVIINHYGKPRHYYKRDYNRGYKQGYRDGYRSHYYHPGPRVVHKHYYRDDSYKWIGGVYLIDELLHHHRH